MHDQSTTITLCDDAQLGYERSRTQFSEGAGLALDESYRLTHLPLIAPHHPRVIRTREGAVHTMGRHERSFSLVLPIYIDALRQSETFQAIERDLRAAAFASKIAWDLLPRRQDKLHATICNTLSVSRPPELSDKLRQDLSRLGPMTVELRGLFSGNINVGRLYFRVYPERRDGANVIQQIQALFDWRITDLYLVGMYNFADDLDAAEAAALKAILDKWWHRPLLRWQVDHLWILGTSDTLVLDGAVAENVSLV